jgi:hypothetical protein
MVSWFKSLSVKWSAFAEVGFDKLGLDPFGAQDKIRKARLEENEGEKKHKGLDVFESLRNEVGVLLVAGFEAKKDYYEGNEDDDEKPAAAETGKVFGITNVIRISSPGPEGKDLVCGLEMSRALTARVLWMDMDKLIGPLISLEKAKEDGVKNRHMPTIEGLLQDKHKLAEAFVVKGRGT